MRRAERPVPDSVVGALGDMGLFAGRIAAESRGLRPYLREVLRQATIIASGSTPILVFVTFLVGSAIGQESAAIARAFGAGTAAPSFACVASTEGVPAFMFGYILAAKVGCGMVAELGSMRVREEIDAIDSFGMPSFAYLVTTRFLGAMCVLPFVFVLSIGASQAGAVLNALIRYGDVSAGTFDYLCFNAITGRIVLTSFLHGMVVCVGVLTVALYFGWKVRGGPVEVGRATAHSMAVNIIFCTFTFVVYALLFQDRPFLPVA